MCITLYIANETILKGKQMTTMEHVIITDAFLYVMQLEAVYTGTRNTYNRLFHKYKLYIVITVLYIRTYTQNLLLYTPIP